MIYQEGKLLLVAGPCALENRDISEKVAVALKKLEEQYSELNIIFSGSFDKANRTSLSGKRGPGIDEGLKILSFIKEQYDFPVITDIHFPEQAEKTACVCDALQIPAFLCRQTDLLIAAARTGLAVNVKKGQFLSPQNMQFVTGKLEQSGAKEIWQTERGTFFGYHNLVVDMRSFSIMKENGHPTIFDATHSVQLPSSGGGKTDGESKYVETLSLSALAAGADGLYIETHPDPKNAISDAGSQIPIDKLQTLIEKCLGVWNTRI